MLGCIRHYYIWKVDPIRALLLSHPALTQDGVLNSVQSLCQTFIQPCLQQTPANNFFVFLFNPLLLLTLQQAHVATHISIQILYVACPCL